MKTFHREPPESVYYWEKNKQAKYLNFWFFWLKFACSHKVRKLTIFEKKKKKFSLIQECLKAPKHCPRIRFWGVFIHLIQSYLLFYLNMIALMVFNFLQKPHVWEKSWVFPEFCQIVSQPHVKNEPNYKVGFWHIVRDP